MLDRYLNNLVSEGYLQSPDKAGKVKPDVIFIVHSAGGLVSRYYNEQVKDSDSKVNVKSIMTLATPHWGGNFYFASQGTESPELFGLIGFDLDKDLYPEPYDVEQTITSLGHVVNVPIRVKSFTEKLNENFAENKGDTKYFALGGANMVAAINPMSVWYPEAREYPGINYVELAQSILDQHDEPWQWDSRPTLWNDKWVTFHSALGSNFDLDSNFSDDGVVLDFDDRYIVIDEAKYADHGGVLQNKVAGMVVLNWLDNNEVIPGYVNVNEPVLRDDLK